MSRHVIVGLSGGVDSAVAALRLIEAGDRVEGLFMFNWAEDEAGRCQAAEDFEAAREVADVLGIPLHRADFSAEYRQRVFQPFVDGYAAGRTPNPDVLCNREVKFDPFLNHARRLGADCIATGHYARVEVDGPGWRLRRGVDPGKDQSYFLAAVPQAALGRTLFPLGDLYKHDVRELARAAGLPNHARRDSTGVCFIGERDFDGFLAGYVDTEPGPIRVADGPLAGTDIGRHRGLAFHTIGQRRGLGIGGVRGAPDAPWFVVDKNMTDSVLWVSQNADHPALRPRLVDTAAPQWIGPAPRLPLTCRVQVRYRQTDQPCVVTARSDGLRLTFDTPPFAAAPGQYAVFYDDDICLGCAEIDTLPAQATEAA
ncbi:tRNA 2-thiouridine(34) synthase MnmA [Spectribacter hydrogenoxidans]|uniref:tRNA-specific 2-thiouridylase MnmA n=1 Tax=Spectribacter hydrogenoxidans TaxID=3075608 RepID=A0ABU3C329_9GAMM|nr:tRNA 2-thiouridine(34) synthase MnmA [Salinisphaera sp. W335]MDT0635969.1 tRNA 2-thiouridine(34) synthase MnmA [Salinisphaera sp. W335]